MTTTLTGSASYSNTVTAPADGDTRNASSVNTPLQSLLNNTKYLYDIVNGELGLKEIQSYTSGSTGTTNTASYDSYVGPCTITNCTSASRIVAMVHGHFSVNSGASGDDRGDLRLNFTDTDSSNTPSLKNYTITSTGAVTNRESVCFLAVITPTGSGSVILEVEFQAIGGGTATFNGNLTYLHFA